MKPNYIEYCSCPNCYRSFPKKEMKRGLYLEMNEYVSFCKECAKTAINKAGTVKTG